MFDGYIIPGSWAREYLFASYTGAANKHIILLPNVIDETIYLKQLRQLWDERSSIRKLHRC